MGSRKLRLAALTVVVACGMFSEDNARAFAPKPPKQISGPANDWPLGLRTDSAGNIYYMGEFLSQITIDGQTRLSAGNADIYLAKFSPMGNLLWLKSFGSAGDDQAMTLQLDSRGNPILAGYFEGTVDFGGTRLRSNGGSDIFVVKLDPNGRLQWGKSYGGDDWDIGMSLAIGPADEIYLGGSFSSSRMRVGNMTFVRGGVLDAFIARLGPNGRVTWAQSFSSGPGRHKEVLVTAADAGGNLFVSGYEYPDGAIPQIYLAKLSSANGTRLWQKNFPCGAFCAPFSLATDGQGEVYLGGYYEYSLRLGASQLLSRGEADLFVARIRGATGELIWHKNLGGDGYDWGVSILPASNGSVYVATTILDSMDFGGGPLGPGTGRNSIGIAKYTRDGTYQWAAQYAGGEGTSSGAAFGGDGFLQLSSSGDLLLSGVFTDSITIDATTLQSRGGWDGLLIFRHP